ncbi:MAG: LytTR family DNA-binding domain-containing protein, partial [Anaerolineales bacterium]
MLPVRGEPGRVSFIDREDVYYIEAEGDDSLIRTARRKRYAHVEPLETVEGRLPSPPFFRIHRSYIVNLDRVYELRSRGGWRVGSEDGPPGQQGAARQPP